MNLNLFLKRNRTCGAKRFFNCRAGAETNHSAGRWCCGVHRNCLRRRCTQSNECSGIVQLISRQNRRWKICHIELAKELTQRSAMRYDKDGDEHYDLLSAFQKSMRGSDPDSCHLLFGTPAICWRFTIGMPQTYGVCLRRCRACMAADYSYCKSKCRCSLTSRDFLKPEFRWLTQ